MLRVRMMFPATLVCLAGSVHAACYADYKAKQDDPLRLHYGVVELEQSLCSDPAGAARAIATRIGRDDWQLLNVLGIFDAQSAEQKRADAGPFYLRY